MECYLKHLPKIGDSLNNFRYPYYTVGSISNEYILTNIDKEKKNEIKKSHHIDGFFTH